LVAVKNHYKANTGEAKKYKRLSNHSAVNLCKLWKKDHFDKVTNDLWEERLTFPDIKDNFTYSLAACSAGLLAANKTVPNKLFVKTANEMKTLVLKNAKKKEAFPAVLEKLMMRELMPAYLD